MNCTREGETWKLDFEPSEAQWLAGSLGELAEHYRQEPDDLPEALRAYWQGRIASGGAEAERRTRDEAEHLAEERLAWRSARLPVVERWVAAFETTGGDRPWRLGLTGEEMELFLTVLNDRRLTLACEHAVTTEEMEDDLEEVEDPCRRQALLEIHLLALFQERCLTSLLDL